MVGRWRHNKEVEMISKHDNNNMASKIVKVSANGRRVILDSKRKIGTQNQFKTQIVNSKSLTFRPTIQKLGKRKRSTECKNKCGSCSRKTLLKNYSNFIKSGLPQRLLYSQDGQWVDFSQEVIDLVKDDFRSKKAAIEVKVNGSHFMLQILYMIQIDLKTGAQKPIAWIDDGGNCVFPESHSTCHGNHDDVDLAESSSVAPEIKLHLEIELNNKFEECMDESNVKRIKVDQEGQGVNDENAPQKSDEYASPISETICGNVDVETARNMFVTGIGQDLKVDIFDVKKCSGSFMEARQKLFQTQVEITQKLRGKANVVYAWCVANGDAPSGVLFYAHNGPKLGPYGYGVHLAAVQSAHKSAMLCDVDENGVKHMVLCRVILGNSEVVEIGSKQFHASDPCFDTGVDDSQNPNSYIIWNMDVNTHIFPECTVAFKMPPTLKGNAVVEESRLDMSRVTTTHDQHNTSSSTPGKNFPPQEKVPIPSVGSSTAKDPKSPWMPFSMLFEAVSAKVEPDHMRLVHILYESFRAKKMSREEFIKKLRSVVGDQILRSTISSLQCKNVSNSGSVSEVKDGQEV
ncbi:inactive poly [ADP-ribose] polymerase RCD1-like isoform X2 [Lactuca sativa]|nr:inactive poly [ADP-ribose] polymerase RCD1-like isoform X2 [Lactuca sativa]